MMESMSRRKFIGAAAIAAAAAPAMGAMSALAKEAGASASSADASAAGDAQQLQLVASAPEETEEQLKAKAELAHDIATAEPKSVNPDPVTGISQGRLGVTLDKLNAMRQAAVDAKTEDYVKADGTVVPAVYVKLREVIEGYGLGIGSDVVDTSFDYFMRYWTEDEAQAYVEMPMGVAFTAADFAEKTGRDVEECEQLCYDLSYRGQLMRWTRGGVNYYHQIAYAHGLWEYGLLAQEREDENAADFLKLDTIQQWAELHKTEDLANAHERADFHALVFTADQQLYNSETPFYYPIPVGRDVIAEDEGVIPTDDWESIVDRNTIIGVSTCQCRLRRVLQDDVKDGCDHPMDTCLSFGEEAQYYIENGLGRQITQDEARAILQRSVDEGMVLQRAYSKAGEIICSCHGDCCDILSSYVALGNDGMAMMNSTPYLSHYNLVVDHDACIKCGACVERCPLFAITMTEDGPQVNLQCVRCGQCATVCPVGARKLVHREDSAELPDDMLQDYNLKAAYRLQHEYVH